MIQTKIGYYIFSEKKEVIEMSSDQDNDLVTGNKELINEAKSEFSRNYSTNKPIKYVGF